MRIGTPNELGLLIRARRRELGLTQTALAQRAGVGRQWIVAIEGGKSRAELGLVLRTLASLGLRMSVDSPDTPSDRHASAAINLDSIIDAAKGT